MLEQTEVFHQMVAKVFAVQSIATGTGKDFFAYKFTGKLYSEDSASAYELLKSSLSTYGLTPLFRKEDGGQVIYIVKEPPKLKIGSPVVKFGPVWTDFDQRHDQWSYFFLSRAEWLRYAHASEIYAHSFARRPSLRDKPAGNPVRS